MTGFEKTTAVVTGASSGIGRAIAVALARAGVSHVLVHYRANEAGANATADQVAECGAEASIVRADLSLAAQRQELVETAFSQLGQIQTWVNNAGADVLTGDNAGLDFESKLRLLLEVDVVGTIDVSRRVAERWTSGDSARPPSLVHIGWDQAVHGMEGDSGQMFATSKGAIMAFSGSLAQTLAPRVRVNTVAPGWIQTSWGNQASDTWKQRAQSQALMHRWGTPDDVAQAVLYVADPNHTFVTGTTVEVNGGWNRRG